MPGAAFLVGERVELRTIEEEDVEFLRDTINAPAVRRGLYRRGPYNLSQERKWFEERASDDDSVDLLVTVDGDRAGVVGVGPRVPETGSTEVGLFLAEPFWGEGYGTEASELIVDYAFAECRAHRVVARVLDGNGASRRIWEKLGFRHEATHCEAAFRGGEYVDVHSYAVLEDEWRDPSDEKDRENGSAKIGGEDRNEDGDENGNGDGNGDGDGGWDGDSGSG